MPAPVFLTPLQFLNRFAPGAIASLTGADAELLLLAAQGGIDPQAPGGDSRADAVLALQRIQGEINSAAHIIATHLGERWRPPYGESIREVLALQCASIAHYNLHDGVATEMSHQRYMEAMKLLSKISSGAITLGQAAADEPAARDLPAAAAATGGTYTDAELDRYSRPQPGGIL